MRDWLEGFDTSWTRQGGTYSGGNWRLVIHTTEGRSVAGALAAYGKSGCYPHFTVRYETNERFQHVPLSRSATAMRNLSGGVETNRLHAVQVEVVGMAAESHLWTPDELQWFAQYVVAPIREQVPFQLVAPRFVGQESGTIATTTAPQRFSHAEWQAFNGVCGHQHVPENHHWDPGRLDVESILRYAGGAVPVPAPAPAPAPQPTTTGKCNVEVRVLRQGHTGGDVKSLQALLNAKAGQRLTADGDFGPATDTAVRNVQRFCGLTADGIVGARTWGVLFL